MADDLTLNNNTGTSLSSEEKHLFEQVERETQMNSQNFMQVDLDSFSVTKKKDWFLIGLILVLVATIALTFFYFIFNSNRNIEKTITTLLFNQQAAPSTVLLDNLRTEINTAINLKDQQLTDYSNIIDSLNLDLNKEKDQLTLDLNAQKKLEIQKITKEINDLKQDKNISNAVFVTEEARLQQQLNETIQQLEIRYQRQISAIDDVYDKKLQQAYQEIANLQQEKDAIAEQYNIQVSQLAAQEKLGELQQQQQLQKSSLEQLKGFYGLIDTAFKQQSYDEAIGHMNNASAFLNGLLNVMSQSDQIWAQNNIFLLGILKEQTQNIQLQDQQIKQTKIADTDNIFAVDPESIERIIDLLNSSIKELKAGNNQQSLSQMGDMITAITTILAPAISDEEVKTLQEGSREYFNLLGRQYTILANIFTQMSTLLNDANVQLKRNNTDQAIAIFSRALEKNFASLENFVDKKTIKNLTRQTDVYFRNWKVLLKSDFFTRTSDLEASIQKNLVDLENGVDKLNDKNWQSQQDKITKNIASLYSDIVPNLNGTSQKIINIFDRYNENIQKILITNSKESKLIQDKKRLMKINKELETLNKDLNRELDLAQNDILFLLDGS